MCTSSALSGFSRELSRSPCLTPSPPPPLKWQAPQVLRVVGPTFCAISFRLMPRMILPQPGRKFRVLGTRLTTKPTGLGVLARLVMAGQAVDVFFHGEVKLVVLPAVADMATVAGCLIRLDRSAEIVDNMLLAQHLLGVWIDVFPFPVLRLVNLLGRLRMAAQAGLGHLRAGGELLIELFKLAVICG